MINIYFKNRLSRPYFLLAEILGQGEVLKKHFQRTRHAHQILAVTILYVTT